MQGFWRRYSRSRSGVLGLIILSGVVTVALLAPVLYPGNPFQIVGEPFQSPFGDFLLGTDSLGRNIAAGLAHGARTSLLIGVMATLLAVAVGAFVGGLAGYYGGWLDDGLMRLTEFFQTIPFFIFAIVLVAILSPSVQNIIMAIAIVTWPPVARLVRGEFMAMRSRDFVSASVCLGTSDAAIISRDILPNCLSPIIVKASMDMGLAILAAASLGFIGLGARPPAPEWGAMISVARTYMPTWWWYAFFPGLFIYLTVLGFNLFGDGLRDILDPKSNQG